MSTRRTVAWKRWVGFSVGVVCLWALTGPAGLLAEDDLYERGRTALDRREWNEALDVFREAARAGGEHADAALYWQAYVLTKMNRGKSALATLEDLERRFPESPWLDDGEKLRAETSGAEREYDEDEELKIIALSSMVQSDPERAVAYCEKFLTGNHSLEAMEQAMFMLVQTGSAEALEIVSGIARRGKPPELRLVALRSLGMIGDERSAGLLEEIYRSTHDLEVRRSVLESFMMSGSDGRLLAVARNERSPELRSHAIQMLGMMGAVDELNQLYEKESSPEVQSAILDAYMMTGDSTRLVEMASKAKSAATRRHAAELLGMQGAGDALWKLFQAESSPEVRRSIVDALGFAGETERLMEIVRSDTDTELRAAAVRGLTFTGKVSSEMLLDLYRANADRGMRESVIQALMMQGEAGLLIEIARAEDDPVLRTEAVRALAATGTEEATEFLRELLEAD